MRKYCVFLCISILIALVIVELLSSAKFALGYDFIGQIEENRSRHKANASQKGRQRVDTYSTPRESVSTLELRIAPWKRRSFIKPSDHDWTWWALNESNKDMQLILDKAAEIDTRRFPQFAPHDPVRNEHWRTPCWLCKQASKARVWPESFTILRGRQLLADDYFVQERSGLGGIIGQPTSDSGRLTLQPDQPYENQVQFGFPGSVFHNGSHFLLFYIAAKANGALLALASSEDGIAWTKRATCAGSRACGQRLPWWGTGDLCVLYDVHEPKIDHRFKATFNCAAPADYPKDWMKKHPWWDSLMKVNGNNPLCLATSPDGLDWRFRSPLGTAVGDTLACLTHDEPNGPYDFILRQNYQTVNDHRAIRGTKIQRMSYQLFHNLFVSPPLHESWKGKVRLGSISEWDVISEWYFDAAHGKKEPYQHQAYAFSRTYDQNGMYWGLTHMLEFVIPPLDGGNKLDVKQPKMQELFHNNTKLLGGKGKIDAIIPYISTSRDGLHFDFWPVYQGKTLPLRAPQETMLLQPAAQIVTPGDGYHHIFYTVSWCAHAKRWGCGKDTEFIYTARFLEGRLMGLKSRGEQGFLRTKPFTWTADVQELGVDVTLFAGARFSVKMISKSCDDRGRSLAPCWTASMSARESIGAGEEPVTESIIMYAKGAPGYQYQRTLSNVQLEFVISEGVLFSFAVGALHGKVVNKPALRILMPSDLNI